MTDPVIVIGAGIAGLAVGCHAQMNGYESRIFELHKLPGGLCTAWRGGDSVFDGCLDDLFGSARGSPYHRLWNELSAVQGREMIRHSELMWVIDGEGRTFVAFCFAIRIGAKRTCWVSHPPTRRAAGRWQRRSARLAPLTRCSILTPGFADL